MSGTGDVRNNLRKLLARLRGLRYPGDIDCVGLSEGDATHFLPVFHYMLLDYSPAVHQYLVSRDYDLYSKKDARFLDSVYRLLRDEFSYKPRLTRQQFFLVGFAEVKMLFVMDVIDRVKLLDTDVRKRSKRADMVKFEYKRDAGLYRNSRDASLKTSHVEFACRSSLANPQIAVTRHGPERAATATAAAAAAAATTPASRAWAEDTMMTEDELFVEPQDVEAIEYSAAYAHDQELARVLRESARPEYVNPYGDDADTSGGPQPTQPPPYQQPTAADFYDSELDITRLTFEQNESQVEEEQPPQVATSAPKQFRSEKEQLQQQHQQQAVAPGNVSFNIVADNEKSEAAERAYYSILESQRTLQSQINGMVERMGQIESQMTRLLGALSAAETKPGPSRAPERRETIIDDVVGTAVSAAVDMEREAQLVAERFQRLKKSLRVDDSRLPSPSLATRRFDFIPEESPVAVFPAETAGKPRPPQKSDSVATIVPENPIKYRPPPRAAPAADTGNVTLSIISNIEEQFRRSKALLNIQ